MLLAPVLASAQGSPTPNTAAIPAGPTVKIPAPLGLPPVAFPADNPPTAATIALGRRLFYDPLLSSDRTVACATCHDPEKGFTDKKAVSSGVRSKTGTRSAPSIMNSAYMSSLFWDGRALSLEAQVEGPITNPVEMANTIREVVERLQADRDYRQAFKQAWGADEITFEMVSKSIASFERTVLNGNSPFDRYYYGRDKGALSPSAQRGLKIFTDPHKGNCAACHTIDRTYALFTDRKFHNIGIEYRRQSHRPRTL